MDSLGVAAGTFDLFDETTHFFRVFDAGSGFDAAGDIDRERPRRADRVRDIIAGQATRKDEWLRQIRGYARPVERHPATALLAGLVAVEQVRDSVRMFRDGSRDGIVFSHADRFDVADAERFAQCARF